jgi:2,3-bisphosphoglycerate-independent phosphoglycerate mutase
MPRNFLAYKMYIWAMNKKVMLMILDGWGLGNNLQADAIRHAHTPFIDSLYKQYPHSKLVASGEAVGLPEGQMGNSEVGHLTIGSGRIIYQELVRIHKAVQNKTLNSNHILTEALAYARKNGKNVHFIGLLSDGGVHSHIGHLKGLCAIAAEQQLNKVFVHAFMDGRDTDPKAGISYLKDLQQSLDQSTGKIASIIGRFYAMDRDNRWERVKMAYDLLVKGEGTRTHDYTAAMEDSYAAGITDEFIKPIVCVDEQNQPLATIQEDDVVICFNFRTDRAREITVALTQHDIPEYDLHKLNLYYVTMTNYDDSFKHVRVIFDKDNLGHTLGEVLESNGKKQIRIAETEKYPHVTFFFSGGREIPFNDEKRIMIPSQKVATYDLKPEMSAEGIKDAIIPELEKEEADFICLNFANPDMVGHTGVFSAVVKAVETVDHCASEVVAAGLKHGYSFVIIADHGNADYMINEDGSPNTAHTTNLVPCILIDPDYQAISDGGLADIAPTILKIMQIEQPLEMNGNPLV